MEDPVGLVRTTHISSIYVFQEIHAQFNTSINIRSTPEWQKRAAYRALVRGDGVHGGLEYRGLVDVLDVYLERPADRGGAIADPGRQGVPCPRQSLVVYLGVTRVNVGCNTKLW